MMPFTFESSMSEGTVLFFVVFQILAAANSSDPLGVSTVPIYGLAETVRERNRWPPVQFRFDFFAVDRIAPVMARPIGDVADQGPRLPNRLQESMCQFEIRPLAAAADV